MSLYGPMIEDADAGIIIHDADFAFGCMGCARTNELIIFLREETQYSCAGTELSKN